MGCLLNLCVGYENILHLFFLIKMFYLFYEYESRPACAYVHLTYTYCLRRSEEALDPLNLDGYELPCVGENKSGPSLRAASALSEGDISPASLNVIL